MSINLRFIYLPNYAKYILENKLLEFATALLVFSREVDLPLLRYFGNIPDDQLIAMGMERNREMLSLLVGNEATIIIENSTKNWVTNQLPNIHRDQLVAEDIVLVNFTRRKVMRDFLVGYTKEFELFNLIIDEIEKFTMAMDTHLFKTFIQLQNEKINSINVTLQKREQELLEAQAIAQIGSFEWDLVGKNSRYTPQVYAIFEMQETSNLESFMNDVHPDDQEKLSSAIKRAMKEGDFNCEYRYIRNQNEKVIWSRGKVSFDGPNPVRMLGTIMDITERNRILTRVQLNDELHKQAQALTHIGNWSWNINQDEVHWSDEMYRIYGLEPQSEEITLARFMSFVHPEDKERRMLEIENSMQSLHVEEYYFRIVVGEQIKYLRGRGEVHVDRNNMPVKIVGTCQDITKEFLLNRELQDREEHTARLNAILEQRNRELQQTNQELESFNFVASHDLQEPLRKIRIYSNRVLDQSHDPVQGPTRNYIEKVYHSAGRMQQLIDDFLSFSKTVSAPPVFESTNLSLLLDEIVIDFANVIQEKQGTIEFNDLPVIDAIPFQIKQLFINLIANALKYSKVEVAPHIVISGGVVTEIEPSSNTMLPFKSYSKISITDNGIGFEQKYATKIFELFQRLHTKDNYSGTGIGLAICKRVVENHQGFITAESESGKGSTFSVYLPFRNK